MPLLDLQSVSYESEGKKILTNISMSIQAGDFISVVGPSGSGKSTLFRLCSHLLSPSCGSIAYKGRDIMELNPTEVRRNVVYCSQAPCLFGDTIIDNFVFAYIIRNMKPDLNRVNGLLSSVNLDADLLNKDVKNLSGGEKQRIALVRSLLFQPEVLLLDEVTSSLDSDNTAFVENLIASLNMEGTTVLWITHNRDQGMRTAKKLLTLEAGLIKSLEAVE